jgi:type 1 fimbriae regulatory protein FimB/type 1 fimbriae regulatory protein FimE
VRPGRVNFFNCPAALPKKTVLGNAPRLKRRRSKANGRGYYPSPPQTSKWAKQQQNLPPTRQRDQVSRTREYLTAGEVERMIVAAPHAGGLLTNRDALLIMMAYRHGFRASELIALRWDQIDLRAGTLHVARLKHGSPSTHPLRGPELRALRAWKREQGNAMPYVFTSLRGGPMTRRTVHHIVAEAAKVCGRRVFRFTHMLRHATGYYLANAGQDTRVIQLYLGHKNIQHTVHYTELAAGRFKDFWKD